MAIVAGDVYADSWMRSGTHEPTQECTHALAAQIVPAYITIYTYSLSCLNPTIGLPNELKWNECEN